MLSIFDALTRPLYIPSPGPDMGVSYNREQLKALVGHHEKQVKLLNEEEVRILFGGLDVANKVVRPCRASVMKCHEHVNTKLVIGRSS